MDTEAIHPAGEDDGKAAHPHSRFVAALDVGHEPCMRMIVDQSLYNRRIGHAFQPHPPVQVVPQARLGPLLPGDDDVARMRILRELIGDRAPVDLLPRLGSQRRPRLPHEKRRNDNRGGLESPRQRLDAASRQHGVAAHARYDVSRSVPVVEFPECAERDRQRHDCHADHHDRTTPVAPSQDHRPDHCQREHRYRRPPPRLRL